VTEVSCIVEDKNEIKPPNYTEALDVLCFREENGIGRQQCAKF